MRLAILALWIVIIVATLLTLLRRRRSMPGGQPRMSSDELVKDPVCGTYIVRSRAVGHRTAEGPPYFCSAECAGRFVG